MPTPHESGETFQEGAIRRGRRLAKLSRRAALNVLGGRRPTRVVFIMGSQRSGTRVPLLALESAPDVLTFREGARRFFTGVHLRPAAELDALFQQCAFPVLVLKPLCESYRAVELLERFPDSRVIWIYRRFPDAVNSSSLKWSSGAEVIERLVNGQLPRTDWRMGGLTEAALASAKRLYQPGLSLHHANAIFWYLRNRLALDMNLFDHPRVLVVKYEDLSTDPEAHFRRVFEFIGEPMRSEYVEGIHGSSVSRHPFPDLPRPVIDACEQLYEDIDTRYRLMVVQGTR